MIRALHLLFLVYISYQSCTSYCVTQRNPFGFLSTSNGVVCPYNIHSYREMSPNMNSRRKIVVILGPTATGKTNTSIEVALMLKHHNIAANIINADSMQVYRGFNIGTAKPTHEQMQQVKHHLFDFIEPEKDYNASCYVKECSDIIQHLQYNGVLPVLVGGTNMYIEGLLWPSFIDMPRHMEEGKHQAYGNQTGHPSQDRANSTTKELYEQLKRRDPDRASDLHPNDRKRIIRSLDVIDHYGKKHSELIQNRKKFREQFGAKYEALIFSMTCEPDKHKELIKNRTKNMMREGIVDESLELMKMIESNPNIDPNRGICQSIAYKEIIPILKESMQNQETPTEHTLDKCALALERATWQYTRKQKTWIRNRFRNEDGVKLVHVDTTDASKRKDIVEFMTNEVLRWYST